LWPYREIIVRLTADISMAPSREGGGRPKCRLRVVAIKPKSVGDWMERGGQGYSGGDPRSRTNLVRCIPKESQKKHRGVIKVKRTKEGGREKRFGTGDSTKKTVKDIRLHSLRHRGCRFNDKKGRACWGEDQRKEQEPRSGGKRYRLPLFV